MQDKIIIFPEPPPDNNVQLVTPGLPVSLTSLIGREQEEQALYALLLRPDVRLLTLTGTAGVGKTRLALEIARNLVHDFADGVYLVSLAPISDPAFVIPTIARRLGLTESGPEPVMERLKTSQRDKHRLLLLDNFEHVITAATLLVELLEACPTLKLLVTSREVLRLRSEHQFAVLPLALPDPKRLPDDRSLAHVPAVHLFLQRVQAITADFHATTDNAATIAQICLRLDGLPLAIELAAARIKVFTPQALLARLDHRLQVLTGGARDLPERQRTLRGTIAWSYELLPVGEQRLFRRLAVFIGGCTLEAVEAVSGAVDDTNTNVLEGIISLVDKSLLQQTERDGEEPRFAMLETIREYGLEVLTASGEAPTTHLAHEAYYLALAEQAEPQLTGPHQLTWFERLEQEHDNLRAALSWLLEPSAARQSNELALRLGGALWHFWWTRGYVSEGRRWLERALNASEKVRSVTRAEALIGAGALANQQGDFAQAEVQCAEGLALSRELGDRRGSAAALSYLGYVALMRSNYAGTRALEEEALALFREVGDTAGCVFVLHNLIVVLFFQGEYAQAQVLIEESLELSRQGGDIRGYAASLLLKGMVLLFEGDIARAHSLLEESLSVSRERGYKWNIATSIHFLGLVAFLQGDVARARSLLEESLVLFQEEGDRGSTAQVFFSQGFISFGQAEYMAARMLMEQSLEIARKLDRKWDMVSYLEGLAAVMAIQGEPERAVRFMSAAQEGREAIGTPLQSLLQAIHELTISSVRAQLGDQAYATAWAEGRTMTPEQALAAQWPAAMPTTPPAEPSSIPSPQKAPAPPNGLTLREMEVLRLLAQGLTSAQIAERLTVSVLTVNTHVRSIYSKLGVSSRSAATRWAIEQHLV